MKKFVSKIHTLLTKLHYHWTYMNGRSYWLIIAFPPEVHGPLTLFDLSHIVFVKDVCLFIYTLPFKLDIGYSLIVWLNMAYSAKVHWPLTLKRPDLSPLLLDVKYGYAFLSFLPNYNIIGQSWLKLLLKWVGYFSQNTVTSAFEIWPFTHFAPGKYIWLFNSILPIKSH